MDSRVRNCFAGCFFVLFLLNKKQNQINLCLGEEKEHDKCIWNLRIQCYYRSIKKLLLYEIINILPVNLGESLQLDNINPLLAGFDVGDMGLRTMQFFGDFRLRQTGFDPGLPQPFDKVRVFLCVYRLYHILTNYIQKINIQTLDIPTTGRIRQKSALF